MLAKVIVEGFLVNQIDGEDLGAVAHGGYRVKPFDGDPGDEELLRVAEAIVMARDM